MNGPVQSLPMPGRRIGVLVAAILLALPALAWADKKIEAGPPNQFTTSEVTMDQGERLTFHNGDTVAHDVTATQKASDGKPLFSTDTTDAGKETLVNGSQYLTAGHYEFICSIHPNMKGMLHVTSNGTPQQRPGGVAGPASSTDKKAPTFGLRLVSRTLKVVRTRHALRVRVQLDEPAHVTLRAIARPRAGGPLVTVARGETHVMKPGAKRVWLSLTRAGRRALRGRRRTLAVIVTGRAMDAAGNKTPAEQHGRTLRH